MASAAHTQLPINNPDAVGVAPHEVDLAFDAELVELGKTADTLLDVMFASRDLAPQAFSPAHAARTDALLGITLPSPSLPTPRLGGRHSKTLKAWVAGKQGLAGSRSPLGHENTGRLGRNWTVQVRSAQSRLD